MRWAGLERLRMAADRASPPVATSSARAQPGSCAAPIRSIRALPSVAAPPWSHRVAVAGLASRPRGGTPPIWPRLHCANPTTPLAADRCRQSRPKRPRSFVVAALHRREHVGDVRVILFQARDQRIGGGHLIGEPRFQVLDAILRVGNDRILVSHLLLK